MNKNISRTIPVKYHVMFWLGYFMFNVVRWGSYFDDYWYSFKSNLIEFPIHIIVVYINVCYLMPKFVLRKKTEKYIASIILMLGLVYLVRTGLNYFFITKEIWPEAQKAGRFLETNHFIAVILGELYVLGFVTAIKLLIDWPIEFKRNEDLAKLQLSTELKFLRTQIQPHFFFNTLNNLYALTLAKSDDAPRVVLKLSNLMQYVLYEVKSSKASLFEEINHLNNYIDIEQIRFKNRIDVEIDITGSIEDIKVPPLLFLNFVENCFKHGLKDNENVKINMSFEVFKDRYLEFKLANSFNPNTNQENKQGIGIMNTERRLKLLFANNFVLETNIEGDMYNLFLKIPT